MNLIPSRPALIEVIPFNGVLSLIIDPVATLANPQGPAMVAAVYRSLTKAQGKAVHFTAADLTNLIHESAVPQGKKLMLAVH